MTAGLAVRFLRRPDGRAANLAALGATAVVALLTTFLIAGSLGLLHRSDRIGWRTAGDDPSVAAGAVGVVRPVRDMISGDPLLRLDLAVTDPVCSAATAPPPGLPHPPAPGEVFVSPALADRWKGDVGRQLSARYAVSAPTGVISAAGLSSPDELVVIRGVEPGRIRAGDGALALSTWRTPRDGRAHRDPVGPGGVRRDAGAVPLAEPGRPGRGGGRQAPRTPAGGVAAGGCHPRPGPPPQCGRTGRARLLRRRGGTGRLQPAEPADRAHPSGGWPLVRPGPHRQLAGRRSGPTGRSGPVGGQRTDRSGAGQHHPRSGSYAVRPARR
jgi:hypothetical protein